MKLSIKYNIGLLAIAVAGLFTVSCIKDKNYPDITPGVGDEKVKVDLYTTPADFSFPTTRANENYFDIAPMVIVFNGHGDTAIFSEAVQAEGNGTSSSVVLTMTESPVTLIIATNVPGGNFFNGTTNVPFTEENIAELLENKTLQQVKSQGLLRTASLGSTILTTLPFSGVNDAIPMSTVHELPYIRSGQTIGTSDSKLDLVRAMAKVTVEVDPKISSLFQMKAVGVVNAPRNGSLYYDSGSPIDNTNNLVRYGNGTNGMAQVSDNSTAESPIYLYESRAEQRTALVIVAEVNGATKYFHLPFFSDRSYMDILRNKHYTFTIIGAGVGYDSYADALKGEIPDLTMYQITVTDTRYYDVVSDKEYYIGVSSSTIDTFVDGTHQVQVLVYTNAGRSNLSVTPVGASVGQIIIGNPPANETTLLIDVYNYLTTARVILRVGTLTKIIEIRRHDSRLVNGVLELPYDDYVWGQAQGGYSWLSVSSDGINGVTTLVRDAPSKMYVLAPGTGTQIGEVQAVRRSTGRSSIYVKRP